jgi:hypothetical protein
MTDVSERNTKDRVGSRQFWLRFCSALPGADVLKEAQMFSLTEWKLLQEACEQRAQQWHDQARRANASSLQQVCEARAAVLASIATRIDRERTFADSIGFEIEDESQSFASAR